MSKKKKQIKKPASKDTGLNFEFMEFIYKYPYLLIGLFVGVVYFQTAFFGYTYLDDSRIIVDNWEIVGNISRVDEAFKRDAFLSTLGLEFYRPIQTVSYMIDAQLGGKDAPVYHITNVIYHFLTCVAIYYLFLLLGFRREYSLIASLIFAVHPFFTHAVVWIPSRGDVLIGLWGVLSLICLIKFNETGDWKYFAGHAATFWLGVFTKETFMLFPIVYVAYYLLVEKKKFITAQTIAYLAVWLISIVMFWIMRNAVVKVHSPSELLGFGVAIKNSPTLAEFVAKFILPMGLSTMPSFKTSTTVFGIIASIALFYFILKTKEKRLLIVLLGLGWFLLFTGPGMAYQNQLGDFAYDYFEHRAYLPAIGLLILVFELIRSNVKTFKLVNAYSATLAICIIFGVWTFIHSKVYATQDDFYSQVLESNPKNLIAINNLGNAFLGKGNKQKAEEMMKRAIELNPNYAEPYINLGGIYNEENRYAEALPLLQKAVNINPKNFEGWYNLGLTYYKTGNTQQASDCFQKTVEINPDYGKAYNFIGLIYGQKGDMQKAMELIEKSIRLAPDNAEAYNNLGIPYAMQGNYTKALELFTKATELKKDYADALKNIANTYLNMKNQDKAVEYYQKAARAGEESSKAWLKSQNLSW